MCFLWLLLLQPSGGTLAHAFLPRRGEAHFDMAERWTLNGHKGHNLFMVTAHEIGHTLGLEHSPVRHALMSPYYRKLGRSLVLSWDDIMAVQQLYGERVFITSLGHKLMSPCLNSHQGMRHLPRGTVFFVKRKVCGPKVMSSVKHGTFTEGTKKCCL